jgi:hypothetical protein
MMTDLLDRTVHLHPAGEPATVQRQGKPKADEALIEEILQAAGLEPLDKR